MMRLKLQTIGPPQILVNFKATWDRFMFYFSIFCDVKDFAITNNLFALH